MQARLSDLQHIESTCWQVLGQAVRDRSHPWRVAALATVGTDGSADARSVVLREVRPDQRELLFYADDRSPKMAQLHRAPLGTLLLWSPALGWQLRLKVRLERLSDGLEVSSRWARMKLTPSAQDYLSPLPPGTPLAQPQSNRGARDYFAVIAAQVLAIDWTELHAEGHRRAVFDPEGARWVQP